MALQDRVVNGKGFTLTVASGSVSKKVQAQIMKGLGTVSRNYKKQLDKVLSLDDHTLAELRKLGHPYSVGLPEGNLHDDRLVHEQSGLLRDSIKVSPVQETGRRFSVYITSDAPYMPFLIYGTSTMRPRRFHELAFNNIKDKFWDPILENLKKVDHKIQVSGKFK